MINKSNIRARKVKKTTNLHKKNAVMVKINQVNSLKLNVSGGRTLKYIRYKNFTINFAIKQNLTFEYKLQILQAFVNKILGGRRKPTWIHLYPKAKDSLTSNICLTLLRMSFIYLFYKYMYSQFAKIC